jgi:hypothetical protein
VVYRPIDQQKIKEKFVLFTYTAGDGLGPYKRKFYELIEKMRDYELEPSRFDQMFRFLSPLARKYENKQVQQIAIDHLAHSDRVELFPLNIEEVYAEMQKKEDITTNMDDEDHDHRVRGSVHTTKKGVTKAVLPDGEEVKFVKDERGNYKVMSAHSSVNKTLKQRFESRRKDGNKSGTKNVHTAKFLEKRMAETGKSKKEIFSEMRSCKHCG